MPPWKCARSFSCTSRRSCTVRTRMWEWGTGGRCGTGARACSTRGCTRVPAGSSRRSRRSGRASSVCYSGQGTWDHHQSVIALGIEIVFSHYKKEDIIFKLNRLILAMRKYEVNQLKKIICVMILNYDFVWVTIGEVVSFQILRF